jgi:hypothetical protein
MITMSSYIQKSLFVLFCHVISCFLMFIRPPVHPFVCSCVCPSVLPLFCLSVCLFVFSSLCSAFLRSVCYFFLLHSSVGTSLCLCVRCLSVCSAFLFFVHPSVRSSVCLSISSFVHMSVLAFFCCLFFSSLCVLVCVFRSCPFLSVSLFVRLCFRYSFIGSFIIRMFICRWTEGSKNGSTNEKKSKGRNKE